MLLGGCLGLLLALAGNGDLLGLLALLVLRAQLRKLLLGLEPLGFGCFRCSARLDHFGIRPERSDGVVAAAAQQGQHDHGRSDPHANALGRASGGGWR
jgi:hypothetical protein